MLPIGAEEDQVTVHKFGKSDVSDVILVAGNQEFYCHKMMLAARSDYFSALFFSDFKEKDQNRINIDVDPVAMKNILEILYIGYSKDIQELMDCCSSMRHGMNRRLWNTVEDVFSLADRFLLVDIVRYSVQCTFILHHVKRHEAIDEGNCYHCAVKLLLAMNHNMNEYKEMSSSNQKALRVVLDRLGEVRLDVSASDIAHLLRRPVN